MFDVFDEQEEEEEKKRSLILMFIYEHTEHVVWCFATGAPRRRSSYHI